MNALLKYLSNPWDTVVVAVSPEVGKLRDIAEQQVAADERHLWHWEGDDYLLHDGDEEGFSIVPLPAPTW